MTMKFWLLIEEITALPMEKIKFLKYETFLKKLALKSLLANLCTENFTLRRAMLIIKNLYMNISNQIWTRL